MNLFLTVLFLLHPGDAIVLKFHMYPELNDTAVVDIDTTMELPLIGRLNVKKFEVDNLRDTLYTLYSQYLKSPTFTVTLLYKVSVFGEVMRPGLYYVSPSDRVWEVIARAGGPTKRGNIKKLKIRRKGEILNINTWKAVTEGKLLKELGVESGDVFEVPKKFWPTLDEIYKAATTIAVIYTIYKDLSSQ